MLCVNVLQVPVNFLRLIPKWCQELKDLPQMAQKFLLGDVFVEKDVKYKGEFYYIDLNFYKQQLTPLVLVNIRVEIIRVSSIQ